MKKMITPIKSIVFAVALSIGINLQAQVSPALTTRLQNTLDSVCNKYQIKGTSAAVLIPGVGVWKGTYGVSHQNTPLTPNMLLGMGSNTKTHIAAVLLLMQEQQLLSLNDSIGKWITGYPNIKGSITIRQCLNHTSGLFDYMQAETINDSIFDYPEKVWTREEILRLAAAPNFQPGAGWSYSNTNYIIAGIIIEKVLNKSPFQAIKDFILTPHQLNHTYNYGQQGAEILANPWSMSMTGTSLTDMTTTPYLNTLFSLANTAGSLVTTAEDNVWFWYKLCSKQILNQASWKELTTVKSIGANVGYGLGIFRNSRALNGRTYYAHGGTFFGYINENIYDTTSGVTIAALTNQDSMSNDGVTATIINALHKVTLNYVATGLSEAETILPLQAYPNPASSNIYFNPQLELNTIKLMDISGKVILETDENNPIDVSNLANGLYVLMASNTKQNKHYQQRIVVQH